MVQIDITKENMKKWLKDVFYHGEWIFILMIFTVLFVSVLYTDNKISLSRYNPELEEVELTGVSLIVFWTNGSFNSYQLINNHTISMLDKQADDFSEIHFFEIRDLNLEPNWVQNGISLVFRVEEKAYLAYSHISCTYIIEDKENTFRKDKFYLSEEGFPDYIAKINIDNLMFKEAVPNYVQAKIHFSSF